MTKGYVVLDSAWARRLGIQRSGGQYRISRRELRERLKLQQTSIEAILSPLALQDGRGLTANNSPLDDTVTVQVLGSFGRIQVGSTEHTLKPWMSDSAVRA